ncbi:MAG TPA: class I SAM-dependent methyltransferase [Vicinamibacterales bacterium]|jgi:predicted methyltransferase
MSTRALRLVALAALACGLMPAWLSAQRQRTPQAPARLFQPLDLGLLEAPDRDLWQKPDFIMDELGIADGSVVAEVGAGSGWFTMRLARRVGPNGIVYSEDIQRQMIEVIDRRIDQEGLHNVRTILGTPDDPRLPAGKLDAVLLVDVYREVDNPEVLLRHVARALQPNGRFGLVDFKPGGGGPGPAPDERVDPATVIRTAAAAGLHLMKQEDVPPFEFLLVFERNAS